MIGWAKKAKKENKATNQGLGMRNNCEKRVGKGSSRGLSSPFFRAGREESLQDFSMSWTHFSLNSLFSRGTAT